MSVDETERIARMGLLASSEPGSERLAEVVARHGVVGAWARVREGAEGGAWAERAGSTDVGRVRRATERARARFVVPGDDEWPKQLGALGTAGMVQGLGGVPLGLWARGTGPLPVGGVAMVGARACTSYGDTAATMLAGDVAAAGVTVVSGGAHGIDAAAHRGVLASGGATVAVLACGVDELYPPGQASLLLRLADEQLVVSEYPPGSHPTRHRFLARNRLIAALTDGTVLVEANARSGARNTVNWAQRCGRVLMAVPGPIHSSLSYLPHQLLRDQEAVLVDDAPSILAMVRPVGQETLFDAEGELREVDDLPARELAALEALPRRGSVTTSELALLTTLRIPDLAAALRGLQRRGLADEDEDGSWRLLRADASRPVAPGRARRLRGTG